MADTDFSVQRLREVFEYNPQTGLFLWRHSRGWRAPAGQVAGSKNDSGYVIIQMDGVRYRAHRLAWAYQTGEMPSGTIDHINGDRKDNRIDNLRDVSHAINLENRRKPQKNNSCGFLGVIKARGCMFRWSARITVSGKRISLGSYGSPEAAHDAYIKAKREHHIGCTI